MIAHKFWVHGEEPGLLTRVRRRFAGWLLEGARVNNMKVGENTISLNPGGAGDVVRWSGTQAALAAGDLGMNTTSGRPSGYIGGSSQDLSTLAETIHENGDNDFTADQSMGGFKLTNVGTPTPGSNDAANAAYIDTRIAAQVDAGGVGTGFIGFATKADIDAASPVAGDVYVAEDALQPAAGTSDTPAIGDVMEYDGTSWLRIITQSGGFPPSGTRLLVATTTTFIDSPNNGVTTSTDEGKIAIFDGTSLDPSSFTTPSDGQLVVVKDDDSINDSKTHVFEGSVPTGAWALSGGIGVDHGGLSGLADDDHTQYLLDGVGRATPQSVIGGTAASADLVLESTSNGTKGDVKIQTDSDLTPVTDNNAELGGSSLRWSHGYFVETTTGDLNMRRVDEHGEEISWKLKEFSNGLRAINMITGEEFDISLKRRSGVRGFIRRLVG